MIVGYINDKKEIEDKIKKLETKGVSKIFIETDNIKKTKFKKLLDEIREFDTIIIMEITDITTTRQLCELIQFSAKKKLVLILGDANLDLTEDNQKTKGIMQMSNLIFCLENERKRNRIKKSLNEAKEKGKKVGRPRLTMETIPEIVKKIYPLYKSGVIGATEFAKRCSMSRPRIVKYIKFIEEEEGE